MTEALKLKIYEDEKAVVFISSPPSSLGHIEVFPKQDASEIQQLDSETFVHLMTVANYASSAVFETQQLQGTNIMVQSGKSADNPNAKLCVHIIPRKFDDGLNFQWETKKFEEADMQSIQEKISYHIIPSEEKEEKHEEHEKEGEKGNTEKSEERGKDHEKHE